MNFTYFSQFYNKWNNSLKYYYISIETFKTLFTVYPIRISISVITSQIAIKSLSIKFKNNDN